jgi:hypothetical protein
MTMNTSLWQKELLFAPNPGFVLETVRDYLVLWRPDELAQLPEPCAVEQFVTAQDVTEYAAALLGHEGEGRHSSAREALTTFFTIAARRLAEFAVEPEQELAEI